MQPCKWLSFYLVRVHAAQDPSMHMMKSAMVCLLCACVAGAAGACSSDAVDASAEGFGEATASSPEPESRQAAAHSDQRQVRKTHACVSQ